MDIEEYEKLSQTQKRAHLKKWHDEISEKTDALRNHSTDYVDFECLLEEANSLNELLFNLVSEK